MSAAMNILLFGPVLGLGFLLLAEPRLFVAWFNNWFNDTAQRFSVLPVFTRDWTGRRPEREVPEITLPDSLRMRLAIRCAGLLLILFSSAHLTRAVR